MTESGEDIRKSETEKDEKDERYWGPCKYCPLSRIGCPMSSFCEKLFRR